VASRRIAYVVNHAAFFVSHRLPLALGARQAGYEVALFTGQAGSAEMEQIAVNSLVTQGIAHRRTVSRSSSMNPMFELLGLLQLFWFLWCFRPDVVHCASPKGVLYGGIAARICRVPCLVLAISGMGYAFTEAEGTGYVRKIARQIYKALAGLAFHHPNIRVIVQNHDDERALLVSKVVHASRLTLIPGSGVDLSLFADFNLARKKPIVLLPARMLKDKGVREFVDAARKIRSSTQGWRFILAGAAGYDNPSAIAEEDLNRWQAEGTVEWLGHVDDMTPLFKDASVVCLPSYREGLPKALLEAAVAGCAVITTDVTGCRESIVPRSTGDLVPARDSTALAEALYLLIKDEARRLSYSVRGRERAVALYSLTSVVNKTTNLYQEMLNEKF
jgi:glycosyltransferase involved in cell wall biosynthesis